MVKSSLKLIRKIKSQHIYQKIKNLVSQNKYALIDRKINILRLRPPKNFDDLLKKYLNNIK